MNRMAFMFAGLAVGLAAGFAAAWILLSGRSAAAAPADRDTDQANAAAPAPRQTPPAATAPAAAPLVVRPQPGTPEIPAATTAPAAAGRDTPPSRPIPQDDGTVRVPRKFFNKIQCQVFNTASNCLTDDIVELFHMTPEERDRLNQLVATTRSKVEEHELERAVVTEQSPTRVVLKIAANPDEGRDVEDAFAAGVQDALGDRAAAFLDRTQTYQSTLFSNFGRNETVLTVTRDATSNLLRVQSRQEYVSTGGGRGSYTSTTMSDQMPDRWKKFFQTP